MKKSLLGIVIALLLAFSACSLTPADKYDNFINDLDAITRLQTGLQQMKDGGLTLYVKADMKTLARELSVFHTEDGEIRKINENFIRTAHSLREGMDAAEEDEASASVFYEEARDSFEKGFQAFSSLETSGGGRTGG